MAGLVALLKHGGIFAVAILASYLALDYRKEVRSGHERREIRERELQNEKTEALSALATVHAESLGKMVEDHKAETSKLQGIIGSLQKRIANQETARAEDLKAQADKMEALTRELVTELTLGRRAMEELSNDTDDPDQDQGGSS
jgi:hypothetical protein